MCGSEEKKNKIYGEIRKGNEARLVEGDERHKGADGEEEKSPQRWKLVRKTVSGKLLGRNQ